MALLKVLIVGAAGETGSSIAAALLDDPHQFQVTALVRPQSANKQEVSTLRERGARILQGDLNSSVDELEQLLQGQDVVISAVSATDQHSQMDLATAAKRVGVKRFVPCGFIPVIPPGIAWLRDEKEKVYNHIKRLGLPYTIIDDGWWFQISFPRLPSGKIDYAILSPHHEIIGDGNTPIACTDLRNVGPYVARIITDDRTLNKYVLAYDAVLTTNEIYSLLEKLSGETVPRQHVTTTELDQRIDHARANFNPADPMSTFPLFVSEYNNTLYIRGDNTPQYAKYLGYLLTSELYPGFKQADFEQYLQSVLDGEGKRPYANRYQL